MYEAIKNSINNTDFDLKTAIEKIDILWYEGKMTEKERDELIELARSKAKPENSYAPLQKQIDNLYIEIANIKAMLENKEETGEPTEPETPGNEYPEYVQPTGAHDAYKVGDKITYNGKKYICKLDNCVWSPDTYPAGWEEVIESEEV